MNYRIINSALRTCEKSNFSKHPMGCVIFKGNKIVSSGANLILGSGKATLHAEQNAIEQLVRRHGKLRQLRQSLSKHSIKTRKTNMHMDSLPVYSYPQCRQGRKL
jgi:tRNA(Arg) A34 adenosine deaminase TadA